jgi:hypothetical protein
MLALMITYSAGDEIAYGIVEWQLIESVNSRLMWKNHHDSAMSFEEKFKEQVINLPSRKPFMEIRYVWN